MANPILFKIENNCVNATAKGVLRFEDIIEHYQELMAQPGFYQGIPAIYDFSQVSQMAGKLEMFEQIAMDMGDNDLIKVDSYVAIIVPPDNKSLNKIFSAYAQMVDYTLMHVAVVHSHNEAINWLSSR